LAIERAEFEHHEANAKLALVDKINAAPGRCIDSVDELQKGMLPSLLTMPKQAPATIDALRGAVVFSQTRDGEGLFPSGLRFNVNPGGPCEVSRR
jgi:hypothetical protein